MIEWQPAVVDDAGAEIIRGGDGVLAADVQFNTEPVDLRLPAFRVIGTNPAPDAAIETLITTLVDEAYDRSAAAARITVLSRACWQTTVLMIFRHESGVRGGYSQFDSRGARRSSFGAGNNVRVYGLEDTMPLFGPPHGYGVGQLDKFFDPARGANDNEVWSFVENIRTAVAVVMDEKAGAAYNALHAHFATPLDQRSRAAYQREIVRRYNGGTEIDFVGGTFVINPSQRWADSADHAKGPNLNLRYPNQVLGTNINYFTNAAGTPNTAGTPPETTSFPWPIAFTAASYGPGT